MCLAGPLEGTYWRLGHCVARTRPQYRRPINLWTESSASNRKARVALPSRFFVFLSLLVLTWLQAKHVKPFVRLHTELKADKF